MRLVAAGNGARAGPDFTAADWGWLFVGLRGLVLGFARRLLPPFSVRLCEPSGEKEHHLPVGVSRRQGDGEA